MSMLQDVSSLAQSVALNVPTLAVGQIRIVLVEDDEDYREAASAELEELGFDVKSFASGGELFASLDVCRTAQIIVLDWFLESGTGDALLLGLREEGVRLPVVFLTGRSAPFIETLALDRGALDFVDKSRGIESLPNVFG